MQYMTKIIPHNTDVLQITIFYIHALLLKLVRAKDNFIDDKLFKGNKYFTCYFNADLALVLSEQSV